MTKTCLHLCYIYTVYHPPNNYSHLPPLITKLLFCLGTEYHYFHLKIKKLRLLIIKSFTEFTELTVSSQNGKGANS